MKKIKLHFLPLIMLITAFAFTGCSEDETTVESVDSKTTNLRITNEAAFLTNFYGTTPWRRGTSISAPDPTRVYNVTEIIVGTDTRARGYIFKDGSTSDLLYFIDIDRSTHTARIVDLVTEERERIDDLNLNPGYGDSNGFDLIHIIGGGGYGYVTNGFYSYGSCAPNNVGGGCSAGVYYTKTFLGIRGNAKPVRELSTSGNMVNATTPCNCSTGEVTPYEPK